ncbi:MAG: SIR2 family protein [Acidimicrobiaceae bacterium]|nr:SIR2 family protein [Acidimicrobiaceae bacterium]
MTDCCEELGEPQENGIEDEFPTRTEFERLGDLFRNTNPTFLMGAGCSYVADIPMVHELDDTILEDMSVSETAKIILVTIRDGFIDNSTTRSAHIEDYLSELIDLKAIAERRRRKESKDQSITIGAAKYLDSEIGEAIGEIANSIANAVDIDLCSDKLQMHRRFVRAAHRTVRDGRAEHARKLSYIVLNYDTLLESALALERIRYSDGMYGGPVGWSDIDAFKSPGLRALVYKLHGSVDWMELSEDEFVGPRRLSREFAAQLGSGSKVMIWPAETKYRETRQDPFAQLAEIAWSSVRQREQGSMPALLVTCGYSFGDAHVNSEIERCLEEDSELTLVALVSSCCPQKISELARWCKDPDYGPRIIVYSRRGYFHGDEVVQVRTDMDWWRFESLVEMLERV